MSPPDVTSTTTTDGGGTPQDALSAFAKAATHWAPAPKPDATAATAFALGWALADARLWVETTSYAHVERVDGVDDGPTRWSILVGQIEAGCKLLHADLAQAGRELDVTAELSACGRMPRLPRLPENLTDISAVHRELTRGLWSTEAALGKAYTLGSTLQALCARPAATAAAGDQAEGVATSLARHGADAQRLLRALASRLPWGAAHSVINSLRLWQATAESPVGLAPDTLRDQGWRWRDMLAGDLAAKDLLHLSDYVGAIGGVSERLRHVARDAARSAWPWVVALGVLVAIGLLLLLVANGAGSDTAGATAILGAFGLAWKAIGEFFGRAAAKGEQALWDAELDWVVAYRCSNVPPLDKKTIARLTCDQWMKHHLRRFATWPSLTHAGDG